MGARIYRYDGYVRSNGIHGVYRIGWSHGSNGSRWIHWPDIHYNWAYGLDRIYRTNGADRSPLHRHGSNRIKRTNGTGWSHRSTIESNRPYGSNGIDRTNR